jgi:hypothetical protein
MENNAVNARHTRDRRIIKSPKQVEVTLLGRIASSKVTVIGKERRHHPRSSSASAIS